MLWISKYTAYVIIFPWRDTTKTIFKITHCWRNAWISKVLKRAHLTDLFFSVKNLPEIMYHVCVIHSITQTWFGPNWCGMSVNIAKGLLLIGAGCGSYWRLMAGQKNTLGLTLSKVYMLFNCFGFKCLFISCSNSQTSSLIY